MFISHHSYAVEIEHILCNVFDCDRNGFGGIVDADYIDRNPYSAISCALAFYYNNSSDVNKLFITKYLENYSFYRDDNITDIGEEMITEMIKRFRDVLKFIQD